MAQIKTSKFEPRPICVYPEIWDAKKLQLIPIKDMDSCSVHEILDSIVLAIDACSIDHFLWPQQLFANRAAFEDFIDQLSQYDECFRITDQWWAALADLCEVNDEEGFISSSEIGGVMLQYVHETGQIENFGRRTPKYKYSAKECIEAELTMAKCSGARFSDAVVPLNERLKAQTVAYYGRFHKEDASKSQIDAAHQEGEILLAAHLAAERAIAKASSINASGKKELTKGKTLAN